MKKFYYLLQITFALLIAFSIAPISGQLAAQQRLRTPDGELVIRKSVFTVNNSQHRLFATRMCVYSSKFWSGIGWSDNKELFHILPLRRIIDMSATPGESGDKRHLCVLLDDGTVISFIYDTQTMNLDGALSY